MRTQKSVLFRTFIIVVIVFAILMGIIIIMLLTHKPQDLEISNVDVSIVKDGVYVGSADNGLVNATVSVEVSNGIILNISILKHDNLMGKPAEKIIDRIVEEQSLEVDAVTSATYSSDTIRKAIEYALCQGE